MTPGVVGAAFGALAGLGLGIVGAKALNGALDWQIARASEEDAMKFTTIRRYAGPIVIATTIAEVAVVGYVAAEVLWG
ncbi:hypothetical protein [Hansschlegelia zhihuaiae]|uniref:Uncharacterized protein n=1 Tax=Hansschlegelia zhihuaiae TaxID=405005 RepID=A0A4V1KJM5_9HYPH|nr:hypothetical protein [Hansschlegelia zhihuaiae]RXF74712.1 hypothetical protein EK403_04820 [Hansschlegelia zhihuaiae]